MKPSDPGLLFIGSLFVLLVFCLFFFYRFYFTSSDQSFQIIYFPLKQFGGFYVSRNLFLSFRFSNLLAYNYSWYDILYFCSINCYFYSFISCFVYLVPLSLILSESGQRFIIFFLILSNNQLLVLLFFFFNFKSLPY